LYIRKKISPEFKIHGLGKQIFCGNLTSEIGENQINRGKFISRKLLPYQVIYLDIFGILNFHM